MNGQLSLFDTPPAPALEANVPHIIAAYGVGWRCGWAWAGYVYGSALTPHSPRGERAASTLMALGRRDHDCGGDPVCEDEPPVEDAAVEASFTPVFAAWVEREHARIVADRAAHGRNEFNTRYNPRVADIEDQHKKLNIQKEVAVYDECTCHINPPCEFCASLTEEECELMVNGGVVAVLRHRAEREEGGAA